MAVGPAASWPPLSGHIANCWAVARPIPVPPPVMSTARPRRVFVSSMVGRLSLDPGVKVKLQDRNGLSSRVR